MAQAGSRGLSGPLRSAASPALAGQRRGAGHRLCRAPSDGLCASGFALDDLPFTRRHVLPDLNRDSSYRILTAEGLGRWPPPPSTAPKKGTKTVKDDEIGCLHLDIKHVPKRQTADGERRKRYLYVASDRASRSVHVAVHDEESEACATAFLTAAVAAFPFRITHVLTDRGSCFTADGFEAACRALGIDHRKTKPDTPQTNGRVERCNGRIGREVLVITVSSHRDLECLLQGDNVADNARRQRVLKGEAPNDIVRDHLKAKPELASKLYQPPADPCRLPEAMVVVERAKDVSHPDC